MAYNYKWKPSKSSLPKFRKRISIRWKRQYQEIVAFIATFFIAKNQKIGKTVFPGNPILSPKSRVNINICNNHNSNYYLIN